MSVLEKIISYLRSSREEARKVSWPSRQETWRYSALVVGVSLAIALFFALLDFGFTKLVDIALLQRIRQTQAPLQLPVQPDVTTSSAVEVIPTTAPTPKSETK